MFKILILFCLFMFCAKYYTGKQFNFLGEKSLTTLNNSINTVKQSINKATEAYNNYKQTKENLENKLKEYQAQVEKIINEK